MNSRINDAVEQQLKNEDFDSLRAMINEELLTLTAAKEKVKAEADLSKSKIEVTLDGLQKQIDQQARVVTQKIDEKELRDILSSYAMRRSVEYLEEDIKECAKRDEINKVRDQIRGEVEG